ncbi:hypothetical protein [Phytohabitans suffuscus]|uniref:hypothetical protein n=1 Tax=Phytohabitans suffuscus TaxID=624315 RepID=UPI001563D9E8|nr:hypothetical protein [Phytohabitans suffuscus]
MSKASGILGGGWVGRRYRKRGDTPRINRLTPRFTDEELQEVKVAAIAAQMTPTGFCAAAALGAARAGGSPEGGEQLAELQRELFDARVAVNRAGTNLNQAVAALNATGEAPIWLVEAVRRVVEAVRRIDAATFRVHDRLR